ncbi:MAG: Stp1/IreP family PP2C-type Ser/Thr phosphatase [Kyrpidia sp.]|nr:Stp1/IreP family PP2C-type Ser/Thr phosphatase [Kyrpidia tusciae]MCL6575941.1 Stp1/IreP family PP2C-type Ser/Thr phosphatase [Kyrpidia sp.]
MEVAARSHVGLVRSINQDGYAIHMDLEPLKAALLADGMGGHRAGEVASQLAIDVIGRQLHSSTGPAGQRLLEAIREANRVVYERSHDPSATDLAGMGTTVVAALFDEREIWVGHIGDSRAYLIAGAAIRQLTDDHSLVNELRKSGELSEAESRVHPRRNVLTRALGMEPRVEVDIARVSWEAGGILLLCSDGLSNMVEEGEILETMRVGTVPLEGRLDRLIEAALGRGGPDNITVVAVEHGAPGERGDRL